MRSLSIAVVAVALSATSFANAEEVVGYRIHNTKINCRTATGVEITTLSDSDPQKNPIATATWMGMTREYYYEVNPGFFNWTWIRMGTATSRANGYHLFLLGNAVAGEETKLKGMLGRVVGVPRLSAMNFPIGFFPQVAVACDVYYEKQEF